MDTYAEYLDDIKEAKKKENELRQNLQNQIESLKSKEDELRDLQKEIDDVKYVIAVMEQVVKDNL